MTTQFVRKLKLKKKTEAEKTAEVARKPEIFQFLVGEIITACETAFSFNQEIKPYKKQFHLNRETRKPSNCMVSHEEKTAQQSGAVCKYIHIYLFIYILACGINIYIYIYSYILGAALHQCKLG